MILRPAALLLGALLAGCIVDYQMRTNRFISPEAQGRLGAGQFQSAYVGAHELFVVNTFNLAQIPPAEFHGSTHMLDLGASVGLGERWDIGLRQGLPDGSLAVGGKYQFLGEPRVRAKQGNFSLAGTLAPALYLFNGETPGENFDGRFWSLDTSLIAGYRLGDNVMVYGGPYYTYHALDSDITVNGVERGFSGHGNQFGVNLGLRFEWRFFAVMVEGAWSEARWDSARDDVATLGISLAALWGKAKE
ncbi:MAG: hypothetical protein ACYTG3_15120 [Planctomycetota bacterium]|jgi:hypothetical protein